MAHDDNLSGRARLVVLAAYGNPDEAPSLERLALAMGRLDAEVDALARHQVAFDADEIEQGCAALRLAASAQVDAERRTDALSADRIQFLETSLEFRDRHGTQPCPVCAVGTLNEAWVAQAHAVLVAEQNAASALRVARSAAHRCRQKLTACVRAVDAPPAEDAGLAAIAAARVAYASFSELPVDDDTALADHVARQLPVLRRAYDALRDEAAIQLETVRDARRWLQARAATTR